MAFYPRLAHLLIVIISQGFETGLCQSSLFVLPTGDAPSSGSVAASGPIGRIPAKYVSQKLRQCKSDYMTVAQQLCAPLLDHRDMMASCYMLKRDAMAAYVECVESACQYGPAVAQNYMCAGLDEGSYASKCRDNADTRDFIDSWRQVNCGLCTSDMHYEPAATMPQPSCDDPISPIISSVGACVCNAGLIYDARTKHCVSKAGCKIFATGNSSLSKDTIAVANEGPIDLPPRPIIRIPASFVAEKPSLKKCETAKMEQAQDLCEPLYTNRELLTACYPIDLDPMRTFVECVDTSCKAGPAVALQQMCMWINIGHFVGKCRENKEIRDFIDSWRITHCGACASDMHYEAAVSLPRPTSDNPDPTPTTRDGACVCNPSTIYKMTTRDCVPISRAKANETKEANGTALFVLPKLNTTTEALATLPQAIGKIPAAVITAQPILRDCPSDQMNQAQAVCGHLLDHGELAACFPVSMPPMQMFVYCVSTACSQGVAQTSSGLCDAYAKCSLAVQAVKPIVDAWSKAHCNAKVTAAPVVHEAVTTTKSPEDPMKNGVKGSQDIGRIPAAVAARYPFLMKYDTEQMRLAQELCDPIIDHHDILEECQHINTEQMWTFVDCVRVSCEMGAAKAQALACGILDLPGIYAQCKTHLATREYFDSWYQAHCVNKPVTCQANMHHDSSATVPQPSCENPVPTIATRRSACVCNAGLIGELAAHRCVPSEQCSVQAVNRVTTTSTSTTTTTPAPATTTPSKNAAAELTHFALAVCEPIRSQNASSIIPCIFNQQPRDPSVAHATCVMLVSLQGKAKAEALLCRDRIERFNDWCNNVRPVISSLRTRLCPNLKQVPTLEGLNDEQVKCRASKCPVRVASNSTVAECVHQWKNNSVVGVSFDRRGRNVHDSTCKQLLHTTSSHSVYIKNRRYLEINFHHNVQTVHMDVRSGDVKVNGIRMDATDWFYPPGENCSLPCEIHVNLFHCDVNNFTRLNLRTNYGLEVTFEALESTEFATISIKLSASANYQTTGLCGNWNGKPEDDYAMPLGVQAQAKSDAEFDRSWSVSDTSDETCAAGPFYARSHVCQTDRMPPAWQICPAILQQHGKIVACMAHWLQDPQRAYEQCLRTECYQEMETLYTRLQLCSGLDSAGGQCKELARNPAWRELNVCSPIPCPVGMHQAIVHLPVPSCEDPSPKVDTSQPTQMYCICSAAGHIATRPLANSIGGSAEPATCVRPVDCPINIAKKPNLLPPLPHQFTTEQAHACRIQKCNRKPANSTINCNCWGDPHCTSFDGRPIEYQGTCKHVLHSSSQYAVYLKNERVSANPKVFISGTKYVEIAVYGQLLFLSASGQLRVNGRSVDTTPWFYPPGDDCNLPCQVVVTREGLDKLVLNTDFGLAVSYDGTGAGGAVHVSPPENARQNSKGLCGPWNGNPKDDFMMPSGSQASTVNEFGDSWTIDDEDRSCVKSPPDSKCNADTMAAAQKNCAPLQQPTGVFAVCIKALPAESVAAHGGCVFDSCHIGTAEAACDAMEVFAKKCQAYDSAVLSNWRQKLCPPKCEPGMSYNPSALLTQPTCGNPSPQVWDRRIEGACVCIDGHIYDAQSRKCITPSQCGCRDSYGAMHTVGEKWLEGNCLIERQCGPAGKIVDKPHQCMPFSQCRTRDGDSICECLPGYDVANGACNERSVCLTNPGICGPFAECTSANGSHTCHCINGAIMVLGACRGAGTSSLVVVDGLPVLRPQPIPAATTATTTTTTTPIISTTAAPSSTDVAPPTPKPKPLWPAEQGEIPADNNPSGSGGQQIDITIRIRPESPGGQSPTTAIGQAGQASVQGGRVISLHLHFDGSNRNQQGPQNKEIVGSAAQRITLEHPADAIVNVKPFGG